MTERPVSGRTEIIRPDLTLKDRAMRKVFRGLYRGFGLASSLTSIRVRGALAAVHVDGHLLILRNSYGRWFTLPGGRVSAGESHHDGAVRELREETGIRVDATAMMLAHAEVRTWRKRTEDLEFWRIDLPERPAIRLDPVEIGEARWMRPEEIWRMPLYPPFRRYLTTVFDPQEPAPAPPREP